MIFPIVIERDECICKRALDDIQPIRMQDFIDLLSVEFDRVESYKVHNVDILVGACEVSARKFKEDIISALQGNKDDNTQK